MDSKFLCLVGGALLLSGCPGDDGGTPLVTATMTSSDLSTTGGDPNDDDTPDDEEPPDDDNDSTTTTTGPDETTTGQVAACVDQNLGSMVGNNVAMGNTAGAGDDFGSCNGGSGSTTAGWDTGFSSGGSLDSGGFVTGGDGGTFGSATAAGTTTGGGGSGEDYVIQWTAPSAGEWAFSLEGSDFDTVLGVHPPMCGSEATECNDDCFSLESGLSLQLADGETVFIVIDGFSGATGSFTLSIEEGDVMCGGTGSASATAGSTTASGSGGG